MGAHGDIGYGSAVRPSSEAAALACSLFTRHRGRIYRLCFQHLRSTHDAEDALQQTFVNVLQAMRSGVTPRAETAWLLQIARNVCLERQRNAGRRARIEFTASPDSLVDVASARPDDGGSELAAALGRLEPRHREALVLREWRGLSYREMATVLQLSQSAVEALLFRARRSLARSLEDTRRLRPTFNWGSLFASCRTAFSGAAAKTAAVAACCGITVVGAPALENAVLHRAGSPLASSPLRSSPPAAATSGVAANQRAEPGRRNTTQRRRPGAVASTVAGSAAPTSGGASGTTADVAGTVGGGVAPTKDSGGTPGGASGPPRGSIETPSPGLGAARADVPVDVPQANGGADAGVSTQVSAGGVSAQIAAGDTGVAAAVGVGTNGADAAVQSDVSLPVSGADAPSVGSPDVSVGADVGVSAAAPDAGAVTADAGVTVDTGQTGAVGVDLSVSLSLP